MAVVAGLLSAKPALSEAPAPLRILAFGTSLTARGGWQVPLRTAMALCLKRPVEVETVALSGSTSRWALTQVKEVANHRPDIVLVEFSANDAALDRFLSLGESRKNMAHVFDELRTALPEARVYSMGMNPIIGLRGFVRPFLGDYVEAHRRLAADRGFGFVDFRPFWGAMPDGELEAAIPDGSHPDPAVASTIIVPELVRHLAGPCRSNGNATPPHVIQGELAP
ncbi:MULTISPECIES: SGNH/GDSL hydrolase family protein [unclassified Aureimonas]|uniref:SGNH/GDSL hydrolase family protein n=1 Tax=unclassified Aureimonas TaxID=2615206 RepID=UPI0006F2808A|nr:MULTISPECIES: SGNH/GDSL hydrolase family protein [unclassified Aureimonas]KQT61787.1 acyl-CoA thioesterase [Aureimonas sp. Leaf427]KQT62220.1 acyl-CoA thioesterase [Aureimonas sp. Leaf460]